MRIISGKFKSRRFNPPANMKARPTTDFARESLFNILNNMLDWEETSALDLFSGTGSIAFELVSRGCPRVVLIEQDSLNFNFICSIRDKLQTDELWPLRMDVFKYLKAGYEKFDFIFADPPYDMAKTNSIPDTIFEGDTLKPDGLLVVEHSRKMSFATHERFLKEKHYGSVHFSFFQ